MYKRIIDIQNRLDDANFLLGARQTGKSTLLKELFPNRPSKHRYYKKVSEESRATSRDASE